MLMKNSNNSENLQNQSEKFSKNNFQKIFWAVAVATSVIIADPANAGLKSAEKNQNSAEVLEYPYITKSIAMTSLEQVREFMRAKGIAPKQDAKFANEVRKLQSRAGLAIDGYLGKQTYEVFKNEELNIPEKPAVQKNSLKTTEKRLEEMSRAELKEKFANYPDPNGWLEKPVPSPMDDNYYYWRDAGREMDGTHLNAKLYGMSTKLHLDYEFNQGNSIQMGKTPDKRHFIALFVNGKLEVLSYMTPGRKWHESPENKIEDIDVLSNTYVSRAYHAAMPFAIGVDTADWVYIHARNFPAKDSPDFGGTFMCYGVPLFYEQRIFRLVRQNGQSNFKINIWNIY